MPSSCSAAVVASLASPYSSDSLVPQTADNKTYIRLVQYLTTIEMTNLLNKIRIARKIKFLKHLELKTTLKVEGKILLGTGREMSY